MSHKNSIKTGKPYRKLQRVTINRKTVGNHRKQKKFLLVPVDEIWYILYIKEKLLTSEVSTKETICSNFFHLNKRMKLYKQYL